MLEDLAPRNGTFVGSVLVREHNAVCLTEPCTIRVGGVRLRFVPGESETQRITLGPRFGGLVGGTAQMRTLFAELERCAAGDLSVCIGGETGTGKELVARAIHDASARRRGPFVAISCADLAGYGLEDALFGHRRGAYTGADEDRAGAFVTADGGTLLFDEAAEMSLALQAKLRRVLETKEVQPLGSDEKRRVNVRTVFATNADLRSLLNSGKFRDDL
jgi:transcriptional regulator with GAF, ATPase, and Fis domain